MTGKIRAADKTRQSADAPTRWRVSVHGIERMLPDGTWVADSLNEYLKDQARKRGRIDR